MSLFTSGTGLAGDPFLPGVALAVDPDQAASLLASKVFVPAGGPRAAAVGTVLTQQNVVAHTITSARFRISQSRIKAVVQVVATAAGVSGTAITLAWPTLTAQFTSNVPLGSFNYFRTGTGWVTGRVYNAGAQFTFVPHGMPTLVFQLGQNPAFAIASGDHLDVMLSYEI